MTVTISIGPTLRWLLIRIRAGRRCLHCGERINALVYMAYPSICPARWAYFESGGP